MALERTVSENLRRIRKKKGLSQKLLANVSGIDVRQISKYENNPDHFTTKTLEKLSKGLGVNPAELLSTKEDKKKLFIKYPKGYELGIKEAINILKTHLKDMAE